ncbi:MAG: phage tail protein I [Syntrophomonadaceae bacterium]|jgi:phage tail P2-like protein
MRNLSEVRLLELIPPNLRNDPQIQAAAQALDVEIKAVTEAVQGVIFYSRIDTLPDEVIDHLAWQFHVDYYNPDLPLSVKRTLVKNSLIWHRTKGTPAAVEELITAVFGEGQAVEWWEYDGNPYMFKVVTFNAAVTNEKAQEFIRALNSIKNARSWLESVEITQTEEMTLYFGSVVHAGDNLTLRQVV